MSCEEALKTWRDAQAAHDDYRKRVFPLATEPLSGLDDVPGGPVRDEDVAELERLRKTMDDAKSAYDAAVASHGR